MPPRRRPSSGYHGVWARPSGRFDAEIRSGDERIRLGTFDTAHEAAQAYDTVSWRLSRSQRTMNFHDVFTREQAEMLAPPLVITREQQRRQWELEQRLLIAEHDEAMRLEWAPLPRRRRRHGSLLQAEGVGEGGGQSEEEGEPREAPRRVRREESGEGREGGKEGGGKEERRRAVHHRYVVLLLLRVDDDAGVGDDSEHPLVGLRLGVGRVALV
nr:ethylene-responsive transcription factor 5-like [Lolium perenne]